MYRVAQKVNHYQIIKKCIKSYYSLPVTLEWLDLIFVNI